MAEGCRDAHLHLGCIDTTPADCLHKSTHESWPLTQVPRKGRTDANPQRTSPSYGQEARTDFWQNPKLPMRVQEEEETGRETPVVLRSIDPK